MIKPGEPLFYHGKPVAILVSWSVEYEYIWKLCVPSIKRAVTNTGQEFLIDPLPLGEYDFKPNHEALGSIIRRR